MSSVDWSIFRHQSPAEIKKVKSNYEDESLDRIKPKGLYFSPGNDWEKWCKKIGVSPHTYRHTYAIKSLDDCKIFRLTPSNMEEFCGKYLVRTTSYIPRLNWNKIKKDYKGIHIPSSLIRYKQYQQDKYGMMWSSYDVETLIVWDKNIVTLAKIK